MQEPEVIHGKPPEPRLPFPTRKQLRIEEKSMAIVEKEEFETLPGGETGMDSVPVRGDDHVTWIGRDGDFFPDDPREGDFWKIMDEYGTTSRMLVYSDGEWVELTAFA